MCTKFEKNVDPFLSYHIHKETELNPENPKLSSGDIKISMTMIASDRGGGNTHILM